MTKIAFYLMNFEVGGVQRRTIRLMSGLLDTGKFEIDLFVNDSKGPLSETIPAGIRILNVSGGCYLSTILKLRRHLLDNQYKVIVCCIGQDFIRAKLAISTLPYVIRPNLFVIQAVPVELPDQSYFVNLIRKIAIRLFYPEASKVICVSNDVRESLVQLSPRLDYNSTVIYNPVVSGRIDELSKFSVENCFIDAKYKTLIAVGRVHVQKDYPTLIRAFSLAFSKDNSLRLIIAGGGQVEEIKRLIDSLKNDTKKSICLLGEVDNPFPYVVRSDLFVMSSRWEGLPNAMIEAMYLGVPVISTDCRSGPREILLDGELGVLVDVGDWKALGEQILNHFSQGPVADSEQLKKRASEFSVQVAVNKYTDLFQSS